MVPVHTFITKKDTAEDLKNAVLVIRAGPFNLLVLDLIQTDGLYTLQNGYHTQPREMFVDDCDDLLVSHAVPVAHKEPESSFGIRWQLHGFVPLVDFVTDNCMPTIAAGILVKLCAKMKVPKHGGLDHRHRVELFLRFMGRSPDFIEEVLSQIKERAKKAKEEKETCTHKRQPVKLSCVDNALPQTKTRHYKIQYT